MTICCDTSFLFAVYGNDLHTPNFDANQRALAAAESLAVNP